MISDTVKLNGTEDVKNTVMKNHEDSWWVPDDRTGIFYPKGQEKVIEDVPSQAGKDFGPINCLHIGAAQPPSFIFGVKISVFWPNYRSGFALFESSCPGVVFCSNFDNLSGLEFEEGTRRNKPKFEKVNCLIIKEKAEIFKQAVRNGDDVVTLDELATLQIYNKQIPR
ncbi:hypothetical protein HAX54_034204 [Datura stramonium]|uniref:Uncharacterized protein n=1 Tax=Datura stramonium TaxID=4076 RepID=A0ABS8VEC3_DATST|nr:hypothetical protein [Datura stramonium]